MQKHSSLFWALCLCNNKSYLYLNNFESYCVIIDPVTHTGQAFVPSNHPSVAEWPSHAQITHNYNSALYTDRDMFQPNTLK